MHDEYESCSDLNCSLVWSFLQSFPCGPFSHEEPLQNLGTGPCGDTGKHEFLDLFWMRLDTRVSVYTPVRCPFRPGPPFPGFVPCQHGPSTKRQAKRPFMSHCPLKRHLTASTFDPFHDRTERKTDRPDPFAVPYRSALKTARVTERPIPFSRSNNSRTCEVGICIDVARGRSSSITATVFR